jgi:hypothetical protein
MDPDFDDAGANLEATLDLIETAEMMLREQLRRRLPQASDDEIDLLIDEWYLRERDDRRPPGSP